MTVLDALDQKIIGELSVDAWLTYIELGNRIGLSASATQRRVERLKSAGVIMGARAEIAQEHLNRPMRIFLLLELVSDGEKELAKLSKQLRKFEGFVDAHVTVGATDVIVTLACQNMEEFQAWSMGTLNKNTNVKHCTTLVNLLKL